MYHDMALLPISRMRRMTQLCCNGKRKQVTSFDTHAMESTYVINTINAHRGKKEAIDVKSQLFSSKSRKRNHATYNHKSIVFSKSRKFYLLHFAIAIRSLLTPYPVTNTPYPACKNESENDPLRLSLRPTPSSDSGDVRSD